MSTVHTLFLPGEELSYECAMIYTLIIYAMVTNICLSLIFSGGLRLISLIKNSEAWGIQLLGLEQEAIIKIRLMTISISVAFLMITLGYLGTMPGAFGTFHGVEYQSYIKDIKGNKYASLIFLMPSLALVVNAATRFYSNKINQQMEEDSLVFVVFGNPSYKTLLHEDTFLFSLGFVLAIPLIILFSILASFSSRHERLIFIGPFQITMLSLVLPIAFILKNKKMKKNIFIRFLDPIVHQIGIVLINLKKQFSSTVTPLIK
jgi:hypothetical protein